MAKGKTRAIETVNIRPGVNILTVLSRLPYRPWFALAEFVDNAIQSFLDHKTEIARLHKTKTPKLKIEISISEKNSGKIIIRDNAAGIATRDFKRAFRPAELPPNSKGLNEFGMGMKSAACWFAKNWEVRTSAIGDPTERSIEFDIAKIVKDRIEELEIKPTPANKDEHFTEIILWNLHHIPAGKTIWKIKEHLASIYRCYLREGLLTIEIDGVPIEFDDPPIMKAPYYKTKGGKLVEWKVYLAINLPNKLKISGFAALRAEGSTTHAGFALFKKQRLIMGSADEAYKPEQIFGKPNSYTYQRLFGELHLEGFSVSHTKDNFQLGAIESRIVDILEDQLSTKKMPLLEQAENYRIREAKAEVKKDASRALRKTVDQLAQKKNAFRPKFEARKPNKPAKGTLSKKKTTFTEKREINLKFDGQSWTFLIQTSHMPSVKDWIDISDSKSQKNKARSIGIRLNLAHPFMSEYGNLSEDTLVVCIRLAIAIAISELAATDAGIQFAGAFRDVINSFLRKASIVGE